MWGWSNYYNTNGEYTTTPATTTATTSEAPCTELLSSGDLLWNPEIFKFTWIPLGHQETHHSTSCWHFRNRHHALFLSVLMFLPQNWMLMIHKLHMTFEHHIKRLENVKTTKSCPFLHPLDLRVPLVTCLSWSVPMALQICLLMLCLQTSTLSTLYPSALTTYHQRCSVKVTLFQKALHRTFLSSVLPEKDNLHWKQCQKVPCASRRLRRYVKTLLQPPPKTV